MDFGEPRPVLFPSAGVEARGSSRGVDATPDRCENMLAPLQQIPHSYD